VPESGRGVVAESRGATWSGGGGELLAGDPDDWDTPIWDQDLDAGLRMLRLAVDTHLITSHHLLPLLIDKPGGPPSQSRPDGCARR
jgi:hypothetical protein